jgi:signal transduction histidine kinase
MGSSDQPGPELDALQDRLAAVEKERDRLIQLLEDQYQDLQNAERLKQEFLQTISHELRTPLTAILGFSDLLSSEPDMGHRMELEIIRRNGRRLLDIVDDMIMLAQAESGTLKLDIGPIQVVTPAKRVVDFHQALAALNGLELRLEAPKSAPALADEEAVEATLRHLVDNAIKFTRAGEVVVSITTADRSVKVAVADTGPGVPEEAAQRIFQGFTQGDQSLTRRHGGMGVGLAVARRLTQMQQGKFGLDERPGGGSVFWFTLPAA